MKRFGPHSDFPETGRLAGVLDSLIRQHRVGGALRCLWCLSFFIYVSETLETLALVKLYCICILLFSNKQKKTLHLPEWNKQHSFHSSHIQSNHSHFLLVMSVWWWVDVLSIMLKLKLWTVSLSSDTKSIPINTYFFLHSAPVLDLIEQAISRYEAVFFSFYFMLWFNFVDGIGSCGLTFQLYLSIWGMSASDYRLVQKNDQIELFL